MKRIALLLVFIVGVPAYAGNCKWVTAPSGVAFGGYSVFATNTPLNATSSYTFSCTPNTSGTLTFSTGANSNTYFPRNLRSAGGVLIPYNLFDDMGTSIVIGNGSGGTTTRVVFNSEPKDKEYTDSIYGQVIQGGDIPAGVYTDTVSALLSWGNGTASRDIVVTTTVISECRSSGSTLAFGNYDPIVAHATNPLDSQGGFDVFCTMGTSATVALGNGLWGTRRMRNVPGTSFLNYLLYTNSGRTNPWLTANPNYVAATSTSKSRALTPLPPPAPGGLTIYGRVPGNQDPASGTHSDTVQATVNY